MSFELPPQPAHSTVASARNLEHCRAIVLNATSKHVVRRFAECQRWVDTQESVVRTPPPAGHQASCQGGCKAQKNSCRRQIECCFGYSIACATCNGEPRPTRVIEGPCMPHVLPNDGFRLIFLRPSYSFEPCVTYGQTYSRYFASNESALVHVSRSVS